jgi:hypothetical protein
MEPPRRRDAEERPRRKRGERGGAESAEPHLPRVSTQTVRSVEKGLLRIEQFSEVTADADTPEDRASVASATSAPSGFDFVFLRVSASLW